MLIYIIWDFCRCTQVCLWRRYINGPYKCQATSRILLFSKAWQSFIFCMSKVKYYSAFIKIFYGAVICEMKNIIYFFQYKINWHSSYYTPKDSNKREIRNWFWKVFQMISILPLLFLVCNRSVIFYKKYCGHWVM